MKNEERLKLFWRGYVCIRSRGPLPPLDLELYPRASQDLGARTTLAHADPPVKAGMVITEIDGIPLDRSLEIKKESDLQSRFRRRMN